MPQIALEKHSYRWRPVGGVFTPWVAFSEKPLQLPDIDIAIGDLQFYIPASPEYKTSAIIKNKVAINFAPAANVAPVASAGADNSITLPTNSVVLQGSGTDSDGSVASYAWAQVIGPNSAAISNPAIAQPTASGLVEGTYEFRLTVTDNNGATHQDTVQIIVNAAAAAPAFPAKLHYAGDSITSGAVATSWVEYEKALLDATKFPVAGYNNKAVSGESSNQQLARLQNEIIAQKGTGGGAYFQDIAVLFIGVNDLRVGDAGTPHAGTKRTKGQIAHDILDWGRRARLAGLKPVLVTFGHDRRLKDSDPTEDARLVNLAIDVNNITTAKALEYGFMGVVDNTSDAFIGTPSAPVNYSGSYYLNDLIHPSNQGEEYIATKVKPVIEEVSLMPLGDFVDPGEYVYSDNGGGGTGIGTGTTAETPYALVAPTFGNAVNATVSGNTITAGSGSWGTAISDNKLGETTEDIIGYVEYTIAETNKETLFGWNNNNTANDHTDVIWAWHFKSNTLAASVGTTGGIRKYGIGTGETGQTQTGYIPYQPGDTLRITLKQDRVLWYQNGIQRFEQMLAQSPLNMFVDMAIITGGAINDIRVGAANWVPRIPPATGEPPASNGRVAAVWKPATNVSISGNSWTKTTGGVGVFDVGTTNTIALGPTAEAVRGYFDFQAKKGNTSVLLGFRAGADADGGYLELIGAGAVSVQVSDTASEKGIRWFVNGAAATAYVPFNDNDRIKLEILQSQVVLYQNGVEIDRKNYALPDNAYIDTSIANIGNVISDVYIMATNPIAR